MNTYVCAEPEQVTAYLDVNGRFHHSRDEAIEANFRADQVAQVNAVINRDKALHQTPVRSLHNLIREFVQTNPDMVRVMIGDRDAT